MRRPLPNPSAIFPYPEPIYNRGERAFDRCAALCRKADAIIKRVYEPRRETPHGFADPVGFVASCNRLHARNRIYKLLLVQLIEHDIKRGRLVEINENGKRFVS